MDRKPKALEGSTKQTQQLPHEWPEFESMRFETAYNRGYKRGWKDAYEKAFNAGLQLGLSKMKPDAEPLAQSVIDHHKKSLSEPPHIPLAQKEKAEILFQCRIKSQKSLIEHGTIPDEFALDINEERNQLRRKSETKLKKNATN
eukprot:CAMPEP_0197036368 /NCGR_PEP_ID=MMETSP1384-20130603/13899_1 /TAXON_ID=29189 /ORGANISM="Ammonia sp." /LENGTH=143 /DNA_ID=CAMNT_0042466545 /DNA_START=53 /DNA_END=485 /DNA_ORIENTATION=+